MISSVLVGLSVYSLVLLCGYSTVLVCPLCFCFVLHSPGFILMSTFRYRYLLNVTIQTSHIQCDIY